MQRSNVATTSQQALILSRVSLYSEPKETVLRRREFICMLCIKQRMLHLKTSTSQRYYKMCSKACTTRQGFSFESSYSFCPNVRRCAGDGNNTLHLYKINLDYNVQNPVKLATKETFNELNQRSRRLKKIQATTREASSKIYVPSAMFQTKNSCLWTFAFVSSNIYSVAKSSAAKCTARNEQQKGR